MNYTLTRENPISNVVPNPDIVVSYDSNEKRFSVTLIATNSGDYVQRETLVSPSLKYKDLIIDKILSMFETDETPEVLFTLSAENEVHMIWLENCQSHD